MKENTHRIKSMLQNIGSEFGDAETDFSYLPAKLTDKSGDARLHGVLLQSLDRISRMREFLKHQEESLRRELMNL